MECLDCGEPQKDGKCAVFLVCEDSKGEFALCSHCWIERDAESKPAPEPPPPKHRKRKR